MVKASWSVEDDGYRGEILMSQMSVMGGLTSDYGSMENLDQAKRIARVYEPRPLYQWDRRASRSSMQTMEDMPKNGTRRYHSMTPVRMPEAHRNVSIHSRSHVETLDNVIDPNRCVTSVEYRPHPGEKVHRSHDVHHTSATTYSNPPPVYSSDNSSSPIYRHMSSGGVLYSLGNASKPVNHTRTASNTVMSNTGFVKQFYTDQGNDSRSVMRLSHSNLGSMNVDAAAHNSMGSYNNSRLRGMPLGDSGEKQFRRIGSTKGIRYGGTLLESVSPSSAQKASYTVPSVIREPPYVMTDVDQAGIRRTPPVIKSLRSRGRKYYEDMSPNQHNKHYGCSPSATTSTTISSSPSSVQRNTISPLASSINTTAGYPISSLPIVNDAPRVGLLHNIAIGDDQV